MSERTRFHRLFYLSWTDFCEGLHLPLTVARETDLSLKQQFLDLVLIRQGTEPIAWPLPDGFEDLAAHNLVTFKSYQEALDEWALYELVGHYVNYRKQVSPSMQELLPETDFRLFAVCARYPEGLVQRIALTPVREGVFEVWFGTLRIRVIVVNRLPLQEQNAQLHVISPSLEVLDYGRQHYQPRSPETSTLLYELFKAYREDPNMSEELKEFVRQSIDNLLRELPPEKRLEGLPAEERVKGLSPEERLAGLTPEELRAALEAVQRRLQANGPSAKPQ